MLEFIDIFIFLWLVSFFFLFLSENLNSELETVSDFQDELHLEPESTLHDF